MTITEDRFSPWVKSCGTNQPLFFAGGGRNNSRESNMTIKEIGRSIYELQRSHKSA